MTRSDEEYLAELRKHAANARTLLSNSMKPERERMVVRAFLRCIGEEFTDEEVQAAAEEPVDVIFRSARFQLMDIVGEKKRGQNWIERERHYKETAKVSDLLEPWSDPRPISFDNICQQIIVALAMKASRYGVAACSRLDALVYVDLEGTYLWPLESNPHGNEADELRQQGWRSVSMIFVPYGAVLAAAADAPKFLKQRQGRLHNEWPGPNGWFDP